MVFRMLKCWQLLEVLVVVIHITTLVPAVEQVVRLRLEH
jgi:hypothetical protein